MEMGLPHRQSYRPGGIEPPSGRLSAARPGDPDPRQLQEVGVRADSLREVTALEFLRTMGEESYDVLVLALVGGGVQAMLHGLKRTWEGRTDRPVVVTGYVGVVYEKLADGLLLRHGADLVLANSRQDAERFRAVYEGVGADASAVTEVALPFLGGAPYTGGPGPSTRPQDRPYTVVFAAQPSVPESRGDRTYLLDRLIRHARRHPEREVLLKLRSRPGEHTTHIEELPYQKLAQKADPPPNFRLVYGHMGEVLDRTDLLVTVSSTAALESLHRRIPTVVLTDLGVREALGNHHFVGSGCLASWDQLDAGHRPTPTRSGWPGRGRGRRLVRDGLRHRPGADHRAAGPARRTAPAHPVLHTRHRARIPARHPRPAPPRPRRHAAARRARRRPRTRPRPADRAPCGARRLPARRAAGRPGDPAHGGAVTPVTRTRGGVPMSRTEAGPGASVRRILAVVPARGGSKGVPAKNLAPVGGVPLVARAVRECLATRLVTDVVVSTDDQAIAAAAREAGAEVVLRPAAIAGDTATSEAAVLHAMDAHEALHGAAVDVVLLVQCTSPSSSARTSTAWPARSPRAAPTPP